MNYNKFVQEEISDYCVSFVMYQGKTCSIRLSRTLATPGDFKI